ncbi:MAG: ExeM/NucH family extracellular endonuclease [Goleter apudmare HA4340-LM2]|jgi:hypothetical protein|nr:ExeM/NucH family extracellular endonuclease [Goleter apudmare HA4340-LM2]
MAATTLNPGDIAIVGYNTTNPDSIRLVVLVDIGSGTTFNITDNGWQSSGSFRTGEGILTYTAPTDIAAGTVLTWTNGSNSNSPGFNSNNPSNFALNASGDSLVIYTGALTSPTLIYALSSGNWTNATSASTSAEPIAVNNGALVTGTTTVALTTNGTNGYYNGSTSGTQAELLAAISNSANWNTSSTITDIANWLSSFTLSQPLPNIQITEYMYQGTNGEFMEFTNLGTTAVDFTGWSYDDSGRMPGTVNLSAFGIVQPGESVILTEATEADFRAAWGLSAEVKVIGGLTRNLGRADEINLYDNNGQLIDRLTYGDETFLGTIRTQTRSGWTEPGNLDAVTINTDWQLSTVDDAQNSRTSIGGDIGNPGFYNVNNTPLPGITITQSGSSTDVTEGGVTDSYTIVLKTEPTADVTINISVDNQVTTSSPTLIFTSQNWNIAQTVTVTAVDDTLVEGTHTSSITHTVSSSDGNYNGVAIANINVNILDNDAPPNTNVNVQITEYMYTGENGEFVEFTNLGTTAVDFTGWSFDDNTRLSGSFNLSAFGIVQPGESVILTDGSAETFRTAWNLPASVKIIGNSNQGLGRADEINLYDNTGQLIDRLTYNDEGFAGTIRTQNASGWTEAANLDSFEITTNWKLSAINDGQNSRLSTGNDVGNPGTYIPNPVSTVGAPKIEINASTTDFLDGQNLPVPLPKTGAGAISGVINDPTDPARTLGINFTLSDTDTPIENLTVTVTSSNQAVVPDANLTLTGTGAERNLKINPAGVGLANITVTVSDGTLSSSYIINYGASAGSVTPSTRFLTGTSDASTAIAIDANYMFVADDEDQTIRLYDRNNSGLPLASFDFTSLLGLSGSSEVDIEASTRIGNTIYWSGSHSNNSNGNDAPNRERIFATQISGTGASTALTFQGYYQFLEDDLIAWDNNNGHGLGASFLGLAASAANGVSPEIRNGFNIEGLTVAPDGNSAYVSFRAPNLPTSDRTDALIIPVTNFTSILNATGGTTGSASFGAPIFLDLGGRGIRSIERNSSNQYLIIAGPVGGATGTAPNDFRLYTWTGNAADAPVLSTADLTALNANGSFESIVEVPNSLTNTSQIQLLVDNGDTIWYNNGTISKDLAQDNFQKFRSEVITLGGSPNIIINEIDSDTPGTDAAEFVELYDGGVGNSDLSGLVVVFYNGSNDQSYAAFDLDGFSTDANGYFVLGNAGVPNVDLVFAGNTLQNGADAVAIYRGNASDFPNGTAVTTNNLVDAIVYDTSDADDTGLLILLNPGQPQVNEDEGGNGAINSLQRVPNGNGGDRNTSTYQALTPTPGAANATTPPGVTITQSGGSTNVTEGGATDTYTIVLNTRPTTDVTVTITPDSQTTTSATTLTFTLANWNIPQTVTVTAVDDVLVEGTHNSVITHAVSSNDTNYNGINIDSVTATITDNDVSLSITKIHQIQGNGAAFDSTFSGIRTIEGIVVAAFPGISGLNGFYVQEEDADADSNSTTSEGIFIFDPNGLFSGSVGNKVRVTGTVSEFTSTSGGVSSSLTQLSQVSSVINLGADVLPTATTIQFPVTSVADLERYEGMLVNVSGANGSLTVTEHFQLGRFGQVVLSSTGASNQPGTDGRLEQYTQFNDPSVAGYAAYLQEIATRRIILDDGRGTQNPDPIIFGRGGQPLSATNTLRGGDTVASITGVLDQRFEGYRVQTSTGVDFTPANPRPTTTPDVGGTLKVASFNVLNYFNGNGTGGGFTTAEQRGAENLNEFNRQRDKTIAAILGLNADVVGLIEIENDGYGANSAIQDLINGLNAVAGAGTYAFINPGLPQLGTDAIAVGFIYKPGSVTPVGAAATVSDGFGQGAFNNLNRKPLAQTFRQNSNSEQFTAVINHFKSKGGGTQGVGDADASDGQSLFNGTRTRASQDLTAWLATNPTGTTDTDYLIMGDINAYAQEDPIKALESSGYTNLVPNTSYSFVFDGQWGSLDHALANGSLTAQVTGAAKWHINADEPNVLDYNTNFKSPGQQTSLYNPDAFRSSDHDPVVVGLNLNTAPVAVNDTATTDENTAVNINVLANDSDVNGDPLQLSLVSAPANGVAAVNNNGTPSNFADDFIVYTPNAGYNGSDTFTYAVSDGKGGTATASVAVTVNAVGGIIGTPGNDNLNGTNGNDIIRGLGGNDTLRGGNGDDTLYGGEGNDLLEGGNSNDILYGENGNDTLLGGNGNDIMYGGNGNDYLDGGNGDDTLYGGDGDDTLIGGNGDDLLVGGNGRDFFTGGNGSDRFYLSDTRSGDFDTMTDFSTGSDTILLSKAEFGLSQALGTLDPGLFRLGSNVTTASDRFIYDRTTGQLFFDEDGNGGAAKVQIGLLSNRAALNSSNITVIA